MRQFDFNSPFHFAGIQWRTQQVPLRRIAILLFHGSELVGCFNPVGTHGYFQIVGQPQ